MDLREPRGEETLKILIEAQSKIISKAQSKRALLERELKQVKREKRKSWESKHN